MPGHTQLLIIDPQNDFCDLPADWCPLDPLTGKLFLPALPVPGAHADMLRLAEVIKSGRLRFDGITVTLDSHHRRDIAHPSFWQTSTGASVAPFTVITAAQVRASVYLPRNPAALRRASTYLDALAAGGRYDLVVWPVHCEIGSWGHNVHAAIRAAYNAWEDQSQQVVRKITKGSNPWTEHYGALQAEVPEDNDPDTQLNEALISDLDRGDLIVVAGEASSHCVKITVEQLVQHLPSRNATKLVLLTDCMSPVAGFESQHREFMVAMRALGARLISSAEFNLAELTP